MLWCTTLTILICYVLWSNAQDATAVSQSLEVLQEELKSQQEHHASTTGAQIIELVRHSDELYRLEQRIHEVEEEVGGFDRTVGRIKGTVAELERLQKTDPQLLQKYSRIYFLNEHYSPDDLTVIDEEYDYIDGKQVAVHADMWPFLKKLLRSALNDGVSLKVLSGYRSYDEQETLKSNYTVRYGTGANQFSADQGYSEHQLGTTVDFTTDNVGATLSAFEASDAYTWLTKNAYRYGFILSYPPNNQYYVFEPWHWRFVGVSLAKDLHDENKFFYDLEQREIDKYIPDLFE